LINRDPAIAQYSTELVLPLRLCERIIRRYTAGDRARPCYKTGSRNDMARHRVVPQASKRIGWSTARVLRDRVARPPLRTRLFSSSRPIWGQLEFRVPELPPKLPPDSSRYPAIRRLGSVRKNRDDKTATDRLATYWTIPDDSKPSEATVSGGKKSSIQFRVWELNSPVNLLINRTFLNVVVMGTIDMESYVYDY